METEKNINETNDEVLELQDVSEEVEKLTEEEMEEIEGGAKLDTIVWNLKSYNGKPIKKEKLTLSEYYSITATAIQFFNGLAFASSVIAIVGGAIGGAYGPITPTAGKEDFMNSIRDLALSVSVKSTGNSLIFKKTSHALGSVVVTLSVRPSRNTKLQYKRKVKILL